MGMTIISRSNKKSNVIFTNPTQRQTGAFVPYAIKLLSIFHRTLK